MCASSTPPYHHPTTPRTHCVAWHRPCECCDTAQIKATIIYCPRQKHTWFIATRQCASETGLQMSDVSLLLCPRFAPATPEIFPFPSGWECGLCRQFLWPVARLSCGTRAHGLHGTRTAPQFCGFKSLQKKILQFFLLFPRIKVNLFVQLPVHR